MLVAEGVGRLGVLVGVGWVVSVGRGAGEGVVVALTSRVAGSVAVTTVGGSVIWDCWPQAVIDMLPNRMVNMGRNQSRKRFILFTI